MGKITAHAWLRPALISAAVAAVWSSPSPARADVSPTAKGITGGALLGAETVLITESIIGVQDQWILTGSAAAGAVAGGVGGYFVEQNADPKVSLYLLMGGMALLIPTTIVFVDATSERVYEDVIFDERAPDFDEEELDADPPAEGEDVFSDARPRSEPTRKASRVAAWQPRHRGLVGISPRGFAVSVPDVEVSPLFSQVEVQELGVRQQTQVLVPLLHGLF